MTTTGTSSGTTRTTRSTAGDARRWRTVDVVVGPDFTRLVAEDEVTTC